jgi:hypothetical protein
MKEVEFCPFVAPNRCIGLVPPLLLVLLDTADAADIKFLRFMGTLIAVTVTPPGRVEFAGFVIICFNVTDTSLFGRMFIPATLTPLTILVPKAPKKEEPSNIFEKFIVPGFIPLPLLRVITGCANAGLSDDVVKITTNNINAKIGFVVLCTYNTHIYNKIELPNKDHYHG